MLYQYILISAGMSFLPWHEQWVRSLYGPTDLETGLRIKRVSFTSVAKKQGKSAMIGVGPLIHLAFEDIELDPEAVGIATTVDQAKRVFDSACTLVDKVPELHDMFRIVPTQKAIRLRRDEKRQYRILAGDGKKNDGLRCSFGVIDEIHQMTSPAHVANVDAVRRGSRGKTQPLTVIITTAGDPHTSEQWLNWYTIAKQALQNPAAHPDLHVFIREADQERLKSDPEYWKSLEARLAANPSHEYYGGFIRDAELASDLERAKALPTEYRSYLRYTLNSATQSDDQFIPWPEWQACTRLVQKPLIGRDCVIGLDLSVTTDLTAAVAVYPDDDGGYDVRAQYWMPANAIAERERRDNKPYADWIREGFIRITEGNTVNLDAVREWILDACKDFNVLRVVHDPAHATNLIADLAFEDALPCEPQRQRGAAFSSAMRHLLDVVLEGKIRPGQNPVLDWNAQCVVAKANAQEEIHIAKPDRRKETTRVDGISALVTALTYAMTLHAVTAPGPQEQVD